MNRSHTTLARLFCAILLGFIASGHAIAVQHNGDRFKSEYLVIEPTGVTLGDDVPVVIYLYGAGAVTLGPPTTRDVMLQGLAKSGFLVISPLYTEENVIRPHTWQASATCSISAALKGVSRCGRVQPDLDRVAIIGESLGGLFALRIAHLSNRRADLPSPKAIILHDGAGYAFTPYYSHRIGQVRSGKYCTHPYEDFSDIADDTILVALIAEETWKTEAVKESTDSDCIVYGNANAGGVVSRAWHRTGVATDRRYALMVNGDRCRNPPLIADHGVPPNPKDEIDCVFWQATQTVLQSVATGQPIDFSHDLKQQWCCGGPKLSVIDRVPEPRCFAWDCEGILDAGPIARLFLPINACRGYHPCFRRLLRRN